MSLRSEIIRDFGRFSSVASSWRRLLRTPEHLMQTYEWNAACAQAFRTEGELELVVVTDGEDLVGVATLVHRERRFVRRMELLGAAVLHEPAGIVFKDDEALQEICQVLVASRRPVVLSRLDRNGPVPEAFARAARGRGRHVVINSAAAPYLDLAQGWDGIWAGLSPRRRHDIRRGRRLLEREGEVSIDITRPNAAQVDDLLEVAFAVEARSWKGDHGSALLVKPRLAAFYRDYAQRIAHSGQLVLCFLSVAGKPAAMQMGVVHAGRFWLLKIGYDERWAKASPGLQLLAESLRWACERGLATYEFLGSDEPWLRLWQPQLHRCCTLVYYPYSASGARALGADVARSICKRLRRKASAAARCRPGNERKNCG